MGGNLVYHQDFKALKFWEVYCIYSSNNCKESFMWVNVLLCVKKVN